MYRWILIAGLFVLNETHGADTTPCPLSPAQAVKAMVLPQGFHATVFASEPDLVQPISFCIDARGRLFVAEALNYGAWQPTGKDRILILEDTDGDGRADSCKVFYEGFNYITGIEVGFGGVWVMSPPKLYFIPMREGADKPSGEPQVIFDGFGYKESRHNLANGFTWGPDGWLYGGHGRTSPSDVGPPGTPPEKRIHCDGGVYRIHPTRRVFENFADGTTNPWGVDFDDFGQCFVSNCVNPHLFHMIQGGHYEPWRNRPSSLYAYERLQTCADHLHYPSGKPAAISAGTPEALALGGGHAHCGTLVYLGDAFPSTYRNTVFMCNIHGRRINNDILKRKGSGYVAGHGKDFMLAGDPWFMGVTLRSGPDGNVFVSDWSDTGECHTYKPNRDTGRIFKISYDAAAPARQTDLTRFDDADLVQCTLSPNEWHVRQARLLLQERSARSDWNPKPTRAALRKILDSKDVTVPQRLRALWALDAIGGLDANQLSDLLDDRAEYVRAWAIQLLCERGSPPAKALAHFAEMARNDSSLVVRLYLASALQRLNVPDRWAIAEGLLSHDDGADANLPLMEWYGIEPLAPASPTRALRLAVSTPMALVRQLIARRVVDDAIVRKDGGGLAPLVVALAAANEKAQLDMLAGARESLRGRKAMKMPEGWHNLYARLMQSANSSLREDALVLALVFGDPQALADLRKTALSHAVPAAHRRFALQALIDKQAPDLGPTLQTVLADSEVRQLALRGLAAVPMESTPAKILAIYDQLTSEEKQDAIATLASRKEYALELLKAVEARRVARKDVTAFTARQLNSLGDKQVSDRLRQVWGEVRQSSTQKLEQLARLKALLTVNYLKNADQSNGRLLFSKSCQQCHKLYGEGTSIGPDLTGANRSNLDYLLSNLIDPSAEVARDYRMSIVELQNGRKVTGILVERSAARLIIQTATERITLPAEDIDSVKESDLSIMPDGQLDVLTKPQIRDLIGYLSGKTQVPLPTVMPDKKQ